MLDSKLLDLHVPKNAIPIREIGLGTVYVYPCQTPRGGLLYGAIGYRENATRHSSFHYTFKTDVLLDQHIAKWFQALREHKQRVADRRTKEFSGHSFKVGDIVTNSWGYDQTNVDWYRVTKTTKNYVWLKPVCSVLEASEGHSSMAGEVGLSLDDNLQPIDTERGKETKHRASGEYVTMRFGCGSKYTGGTKYESWYA